MSKFKRCETCGLKIRCENQERHDKGIHHKIRLNTLAKAAKKKAMAK